MFRFGHQNIKGFTLLEILVSTIILAIGLLGLAGMQTLALKDNQDAFFYAQASSLAYEMSDRIKVNSVPWQSATLPSTTTCNNQCDFANPCTPDQMANFDYCAWRTNVQNRISTSAIATVAASGSTGVCHSGSSRLCLSISWPRNHQPNSTSAATLAFQLEIAP